MANTGRARKSKLSPAQRNAIRYAWTDREDNLRIDMGVARISTIQALRRLGLVDTESWVLTNKGRKLFYLAWA